MDDNTFWPKDEQGSHLYDLEGDSLAVWKEMEKLVDEGLVESIGLSNFNEKEVQVCSVYVCMRACGGGGG